MKISDSSGVLANLCAKDHVSLDKKVSQILEDSDVDSAYQHDISELDTYSKNYFQVTNKGLV